jgi:hypothetical protein
MPFRVTIDGRGDESSGSHGPLRSIGRKTETRVAPRLCWHHQRTYIIVIVVSNNYTLLRQ